MAQDVCGSEFEGFFSFFTKENETTSDYLEKLIAVLAFIDCREGYKQYNKHTFAESLIFSTNDYCVLFGWA